jgi:hypothetical protein
MTLRRRRVRPTKARSGREHRPNWSALRRMCNAGHPKTRVFRYLDRMAIERDDDDVREIGLRNLMERFRAAEEQALVKRGIALWTHAERLLGIVPYPDIPLPRNKIN